MAEHDAGLRLGAGRASALPGIGYLKAAVIAAAVAGFALLLWYSSISLLLAFAGVLLGIAFYSAAQLISHITRLPMSWSLALTLLLLAGIACGLVVLLGPHIAEQIKQLRTELPAAWEHAHWQLQDLQWGRELLEKIQKSSGSSSLRGPVGAIFSAVSTSVSVLGSLVIVFFLGLYFAADPGLYRRGMLALVPAEYQSTAAEAIEEVGRRLRRWLTGKLALMLFVGVTTSIGLWALGSPLVITLALLAALLDFIPNFGPVISAVPAVLLAFSQGPEQAVWVLLLYLTVQVVESYILQPLVQQKAVSVPPSLTLVSQMIAGSIFGAPGLILAMPLTVAVVSLVQTLYVHRYLHNASSQAAEHHAQD